MKSASKGAIPPVLPVCDKKIPVVRRFFSKKSFWGALNGINNLITLAEMTRAIAIRKIGGRTGYSEQVVSDVLNELIRLVTEEAKKGNQIRFNNFGRFVPKSRKGRVYREIGSSQIRKSAEKKVVVFKPSRNFLMRVQEDDAS